MTEKQKQMAILLQDLALAFIINSAATILGGGFQSAGAYWSGMGMAFCINYIAGLVIPVESIGRGAAEKLKLRDGGFPHRLVRTAVVNAIFVTIISLSIAMIQGGLGPDLLFAWLSTYPALHIVGLIASLLLEAPCACLAQTLIPSSKPSKGA